MLLKFQGGIPVTTDAATKDLIDRMADDLQRIGVSVEFKGRERLRIWRSMWSILLPRPLWANWYPFSPVTGGSLSVVEDPKTTARLLVYDLDAKGLLVSYVPITLVAVIAVLLLGNLIETVVWLTILVSICWVRRHLSVRQITSFLRNRVRAA